MRGARARCARAFPQTSCPAHMLAPCLQDEDDRGLWNALDAEWGTATLLEVQAIPPPDPHAGVARTASDGRGLPSCRVLPEMVPGQRSRDRAAGSAPLGAGRSTASSGSSARTGPCPSAQALPFRVRSGVIGLRPAGSFPDSHVASARASPSAQETAAPHRAPHRAHPTPLACPTDTYLPRYPTP